MLYQEKLHLFLNKNHLEKEIQYPIGYIEETTIESLIIQEMIPSKSEKKITYIDETKSNIIKKTLENPIEIDNKHIKVVDIIDLEEKDIFYLILKINEIEFAYLVSVDYLNAIFAEAKDMEEILSYEFLMTRHLITKKFVIIQDTRKNPIVRALCTSDYKQHPPLNDNYDIGGIYLNMFGEKYLYLGELYLPINFEYPLDFQTKNKVNIVSQNVWLPITSVEKNNLSKKMPIEKHFSTLEDFLQEYIGNIYQFVKQEGYAVYNKVGLQAKSFNEHIFLNLLLLNNDFNPVVKDKQLFDKNIKFNLNFKEYFVSCAYDLLIPTLLDIAYTNMSKREWEIFVKKMSVDTYYAIHGMIIFDILRNTNQIKTFNFYYKISNYFTEYTKELFNLSVSFKSANDYLAYILNKNKDSFQKSLQEK